jgi:hypothetical protein
MRIARFFVAMVVLATPIAAAAQAGPAACTRLTKEDAAAALGESVTGPKANSRPGGPSSCEFSGSGLHKINLNVIPMDGRTAGMYKMMCAQKSKEGLTGLGDTTCWYNDKHEELQVLKGMTFYSIELRKSGNPTEAIKAVAEKIYQRLK